MKRFLLSCLLLIIFITPSVASELTVSMFDNSKIFVTFDGQRYNTYASSVTISGVNPGSHKLEVFFYRSIRDYSNDYPTRAFSGYISISPNCSVFGLIDEFSSFKIIRTETLGGYTGNNNPYYNGYNSGYNSNWSTNDYWTDYNNYNASGGSYQGYGYNGSGYYNMPPAPVSNTYYGMSFETFVALKSTIVNTSFDSNRLNIACSAIKMNGIYSSQLCELMQLLSFESNRLDLAKFAYPFVVDKGNFFIVANAFNFSSSADELFDYIGAY